MRLKLDMVIKFLFGFLAFCIRCKEISFIKDLLRSIKAYSIKNSLHIVYTLAKKGLY